MKPIKYIESINRLERLVGAAFMYRRDALHWGEQAAQEERKKDVAALENVSAYFLNYEKGGQE